MKQTVEEHLKDPTYALLQEVEARLQEEAAILEELCDLVLPAARPTAGSIHEAHAVPEQEEDVAALEALCGSLPARQRQAEWLAAPALQLSGGMDFLDATHQGKDGDTGLVATEEYWFLLDGRFAKVQRLGSVRVTGNQLLVTRHTLIAARLVGSYEVARSISLPDAFVTLRRSLYPLQGLPGLEHVADLDERRARFDSIVKQYMKLVSSQAQGLRQVGDSPAE